MKTRFIGILSAAMFVSMVVSCSTKPDKPSPRSIESNRAHLQITLTFNPDLYQKPTFFLPKAYPSYAIWLEDSVSGEPQTIYVTGKAGQNKWISAKERPESVPVWFGVRKREKSEMAVDIDAVSGATPSGESAVIYWPIPASWKNREASLYIEANISFDYNESFNNEKGTPGYSGVNGQPSIIWRTELELAKEDLLDIAPEIVGHGHVSGIDHHIDPDMSGITTATRIFQYVGVNYYSGIEE
jgi:hypothetical protein